MAYCTFPNKAVAEEISLLLVREGIVACANIFPPHTAIYSWQNQIQKDEECAALFKMNSRKRTALTERIRATHPYQTPALVFWTADGGAPEFLNWVYDQSL